VDEWILRLMPLAVRTPALLSDDAPRDLARFRLRIIPPHERPATRASRPQWCAYDVGPVRVLGLDSHNPDGGVGGSFTSEQLAWLVRELHVSRDRYVVLASHDGARTMTNAVPATTATHDADRPPRVLGPEVVSVLLAHANVIAWVSGTLHDRGGRRHGDHAHGFWELPGAVSGLGTPLAGGLAVRAEPGHPHRSIVLRGALAGDRAPGWELRDPLSGAVHAASPR
jgi:hypothetical protein